MEEAEARVRKAWQGCASAFAASKLAAADDAIDDIVRRYSAPGRHYHTLRHIAAMLDLIGADRTAFPNQTAAQLAAIYHDAVYCTERSDNEAASARLASSQLRELGASGDLVERAVCLIEATAHTSQHVADRAPSEERDRFVDCDLAILAAAACDYDAYASAIRREYVAVPDAIYLPGRCRVLEHFLGQDRIYRAATTPTFWESSARVNLERERAMLAAKLKSLPSG